jgi:hypothetical protein
VSNKVTRHIKIAAKAAFYVVSTVVIYSIFGLLLNISAFFLFWMMLVADVGGTELTVMGTITAFFKPLLSWQGIAAIFSFIFVCPLAYFLIGKKQGVLKAVHYAINEDKLFISNYLLDKFAEYSVANKKKRNLESNSTLYDNYLSKLNKLPFAMRWMIRYVAATIGIEKFLESIIEIGESSAEFEKELGKTSDNLSHKVEFRLCAPSIMTPIFLVSANFIMIAVFAYSAV